MSFYHNPPTPPTPAHESSPSGASHSSHLLHTHDESALTLNLDTSNFYFDQTNSSSSADHHFRMYTPTSADQSAAPQLPLPPYYYQHQPDVPSYQVDPPQFSSPQEASSFAAGYAAATAASAASQVALLSQQQQQHFFSPSGMDPLYLPAPTALFDDFGSGSEFLSDLSSPAESLLNEQASYFPSSAGLFGGSGHDLSYSSPTDGSFCLDDVAPRPASPFTSDQSRSAWFADAAPPLPLPTPLTSSRRSSSLPRSSKRFGASSSPRSVGSSISKANNTNTTASKQSTIIPGTPPSKTISTSATTSTGTAAAAAAVGVQLDCNGRKPRQWRNRKYKCSHCNLVFYDRDLDLYAKHIRKVEAAVPVDSTEASGLDASGRRFKCPEPSCPWHHIGFVRKLEQQKHHTRKHGNPTFACRFWMPDGAELYRGAGVCTTRWHADSGNRLRHERAVHGLVWSEEVEAHAEAYKLSQQV